MMLSIVPTPTISQLEAEGYTGIYCRCLDPACRNCVVMPFKLIRTRQPRLMISAMTIAELGAKMPCSRCGGRGRLVEYKPHRQSDAPGYAKTSSYSRPGAGPAQP